MFEIKPIGLQDIREAIGKIKTSIYNSMIAPMMLYCFPVYLGLAGAHQNFTKLETRAYKTIKTQL